tara:strand:- start:113 stop:823 length:711 start_codon:yes stop_codon:yes gene_type:complete
MLRTVELSRAKKTKGLAVTYRAGNGDKFGTCPSNCSLNDSGKGAKEIDKEYLTALLHAKPAKGLSFTYSHFDYKFWLDKMRSVGKTVVNWSAPDPVNAAVFSKQDKVPTVVVLSEKHWEKLGKKSFDSCGAKFVRCPAEYRKNFGCQDCGNGEPLCARMDRDFIVGFTAHGASKRKAADETQQGGCYAAQGNCRIWWQDTAESKQDETDGEKLKRFVSGLSPRSIIRHHVAGDVGK